MPALDTNTFLIIHFVPILYAHHTLLSLKQQTHSTAAPEQKKDKIALLKKKAAKKKIKVKHIIEVVKSPPRNRGPRKFFTYVCIHLHEMCTHALLYFAVSFIATKKWMQMHDLAKAYKATHDNLDVSSTDKENTALFKWSKNPLD